MTRTMFKLLKEYPRHASTCTRRRMQELSADVAWVNTVFLLPRGLNVRALLFRQTAGRETDAVLYHLEVKSEREWCAPCTGSRSLAMHEKHECLRKEAPEAFVQGEDEDLLRLDQILEQNA